MITHNMLLRVIYYDSDTGIFTWRYRPIDLFNSVDKIENVSKMWNTRFANKIAGNITRKGYRRIQIKINGIGKSYLEHVLAWFYVTGEYPDNEIDHIDHNGTNNSFNNLRIVSHNENGKNQSMSKNNTSGHNGICWHEQSGKWLARVKYNNKYVLQKTFININDAILERDKILKIYRFHKNHGRKND